MIATFKKKGWMKLMRYTGKNITQLLTSQLALMKSQLTMMKNVMTTRIVYEEEDVQQNLTYLLELKEVEIGELLVVNEQLEQENTKLREEIRLLKDQVSYLTHQCNLSSQSAVVAQQQMLSVQTTQEERPEITALSLKGDDKKV